MVVLAKLDQQITDCKACKRLRAHCKEIARVKRKAFINQVYWGKPVPGFGDPQAYLWVVGLAPAAHGANRTGRVFTGDRSGDWLYRALYKAGFANQPESTSKDDGLRLKNAYVSSVVRCAPPDNRPTPEEIRHCEIHLKQELFLLNQVRVIVALGQIALQGIWPWVGGGGRRPQFGHNRSIELPDGKNLILSYHPSQQNTFTGRLTEPMFDSVFDHARKIIG